MKKIFIFFILFSFCSCREYKKPSAEESKKAIVNFMGDFNISEIINLPFKSEVNPMQKERVYDVLLGLGYIFCLLIIGFIIRKGIKRFNVIGFTVLGIAIIFIFFTNTSFYEYKSTTLEEDKIIVSSWLSSDDKAEYNQIEGFGIYEGDLFPYFQDDRELLVFVKGKDKPLRIPAFTPLHQIIAFILKDKIQ